MCTDFSSYIPGLSLLFVLWDLSGPLWILTRAGLCLIRFKMQTEQGPGCSRTTIRPHHTALTLSTWGACATPSSSSFCSDWPAALCSEKTVGSVIALFSRLTETSCLPFISSHTDAETMLVSGLSNTVYWCSRGHPVIWFCRMGSVVMLVTPGSNDNIQKLDCCKSSF